MTLRDFNWSAMILALNNRKNNFILLPQLLQDFPSFVVNQGKIAENFGLALHWPTVTERILALVESTKFDENVKLRYQGIFFFLFTAT
jgi:hypothetical protein